MLRRSARLGTIRSVARLTPAQKSSRAHENRDEGNCDANDLDRG
jgi:hypothetical protein